MNNLLTNVEQNTLVIILQSFSTVTSSLQNLANEVSSLRTEISSLETTVSTMKQEISTMSTRIQALEHEVVEMRSGYSTTSANTEVPAITGIAAIKPFKDMAFSRNYPHPKYDSGSTRQFAWPLYRQLGKDIMTRHKGAEHWKETYFLTFKSNVVHYGIATAQRIRTTLQLPESTSWNNLNPQQKEAAIEALEACVGDEYPLSACEGSWGARLLMVNAWGKTKESATNDDNDTANEVPEASRGEVSEVPEVYTNNENEEQQDNDESRNNESTDQAITSGNNQVNESQGGNDK